MALAYLLCVVGALAALAGLLRHRPAPEPPHLPPLVPVTAPVEPEHLATVTDLGAILRAAADHLDAYLPTA